VVTFSGHQATVKSSNMCEMAALRVAMQWVDLREGYVRTFIRTQHNPSHRTIRNPSQRRVSDVLFIRCLFFVFSTWHSPAVDEIS